MAVNHHPDRLGPAPAHPGPPTRRWPRLPGLVAPLLVALLILGMYWKLVLSDEYTWLESPDLANQVLPWFQYQAGEWHAGRFPLWEAYHWGGQPLLGQAQPGAAYPLNWLLFALPLHHGWIPQVYLHWYFALIHVLAALFAYALARDIGSSRWASVAGGAAFSLCGYVGGIDWPQMLNGAIWIPLVLLFLLRVLRGARPVASAILGGFFLGVAWLAGHHQIPIFTSLAAGGVWLYGLLGSARAESGNGRPEPELDGLAATSASSVAGFLPNRRPLGKLALLAAIFFAVALATSGLQTLPALEYGKLAKRWVGVDEPVAWNQPVPYRVHQQYSFTPSSVFGIVLINRQRVGDPYTGVALLALALIGVAARRRRREVRVLAGIALGGLLFSFGAFNFLHGILYALAPLVEKARSPHMAIHLFSFGVSILAAVGLDAVLEARDAAWLRRANLLLGWVAALLFTVGLGALLAGKLEGDDRMMLAPLAAGGLALLLLAWRKEDLPPSALCAGATFLVLFELGAVLGFVWYDRFDKNRQSILAPMTAHADIAAFLYSRPEPVRVTVDPADIVQYNFGDFYGIGQQGGYLASLTANLLSQQLGGDHIWDLFGVNYSIAREKFRPEQQLVLESRSGLKVFRNPNAFPKAFPVHSIQEVNDPYALRAAFDDREADLLHKAILFPPPPAAERPKLEVCAGADEVRLSVWRPGEVRVAARMACRGMVIVGDTYFPGWKATLDGNAVRIWEVDGLVRGVEVPPGSHTIAMVYRPNSAILGALLSLAGLLAAMFAALGGRWIPADRVAGFPGSDRPPAGR